MVDTLIPKPFAGREYRAKINTGGWKLTAESRASPAISAYGLRGDTTRLGQIVGNLLENSCKYSPDGARIVLSLSRQEDQAVLCVRDDGMGIPSEDLPHIFEPYFRGSNSAQAPQGGLGLGLTLTRRLVCLHGGTIEAASRGPGRGSEFTVRLPAGAAEPDPARTQP